jgi:hypothetical protein
LGPPATDVVLLRDMFGDIINALKQKVEVYDFPAGGAPPRSFDNE